MKVFTSISEFPEGSSGFDQNGFYVSVIEEDARKKGLYKLFIHHVFKDEKTKMHTALYGKCNQDEIIEMSKSMIEVPE